MNNKIYQVIGGPPPPEEFIKKFEEALNNLIEEDRHKGLNIGRSALGYIKSKLKEDNIQLLDNQQLKKLIWSQWDYYNDFCINCIDKKIYILEVNFNDHKKAESLIKKIDNEFPLNLEGSMKGTFGLTIPIANNSYIILIDTKSYKNDQNIAHEFGHCVQLITGELILDGKLKDEIIKHFNLNDTLERYVLNENDFWINIFNDFFNGLQKIYWLKFKNDFTWEKYIEMFLTSFKNEISTPENIIIKELWSKEIGTKLYYFNVLGAIAYAKESFFDEIVEKLKNK